MKKFLALALCALLIVPMILAVSAADELTDVTLRWDFNDLKEKNGQIELIENEKSSGNADLIEYNDGVMSILDHGVDYDLSTPIVLDHAHDWSVEWRGALADYSILLGSDTKGSLIYLAAGVGQWSNPIRIIPDGSENPIFVDSTNKGISFGDYLDAAYEMNTWRITYTAKDMAVIVEILVDGKWEEVGSAVTDEEYTITFTRLFGRYATNAFANFSGDIDYLEIKARAAVAAPATEAPATEAPATEAPATEAPATEAPATEAPATEAPATEAPATEAPATEAPATEAPATEAPATEAPAVTPDAPATADIAIVFAAIAAIATSGAIVLKKKH